MITYALIKKNRCIFEKMEELALPLLYTEHTEETRKKIKQSINDYIWSIIGPYIEFIQVEQNDFITSACNNIISDFPHKQPDDFMYHTKSSYSFPKKFIEFICCQPIWKEYTHNTIENINNLGCLMSLDHTLIENSCVVISNKYDISQQSNIIMDSITKDDIIKIIRRRYFLTAVLIKKDKLVKYYYQNPRYLITKIYNIDESASIQKMSESILKYNLQFYFQYDKTKYINQIATRINGMYRLYGDVLLLHELEDNIFANISIHEVKRLNVLLYGRLYDRQLKSEEIHTSTKVVVDENGNEQEKKIVPYWSRYLTIENRMKNWNNNKDKCINCHNKIVKQIICDKCYRTKYCSKNCQDEFSSYHDDECINPSTYK